ncbi:unnamed protein product, partial [Mesorhabditis spiculigera]
MAPTKILAVGDVNGKFYQLQKKLNQIVKKSGPFDMLLCVGEFFGEDDDLNRKLMDGQIDFPVHTYILGPCCPSTSAYYPDENAEITSDITYLGKRGILNSPSGLTIAYMSGLEGQSSSQVQFNIDDVVNMLKPVEAVGEFTGVDILLTSVWPAEVAKHSTNVPPKEIEGSKLISRLATGLRPRYHIAGGGIHYERTPYRNHRIIVEKQRHCTRFIGLAAVDNTEKEKWIYAFAIQPLKGMTRDELTVQPDNATEFPYMEILEAQVEKERDAIMNKLSNEGGARNNFFDMNVDMNKDNDIGSRKRNNREFLGNDDGPANKREQQPCWFCLSNVDAEKHLVVSIGSTCYAAMPKGPLTDDHVLVLSIGHIQSLVAAPADVREELDKYKNAFTLAADKANKALVVFERNFKTQHMQLQMIPVPKSCVKGLRTAFLNHANLTGIEFTFLGEKDNLADLVNEGCPYFFVELPDGTRLFTTTMRNFPLQFGREVLALPTVLDCEEKADWRACALDKEKETELSKQLQARFKPFDFTDDGDSD